MKKCDVVIPIYNAPEFVKLCVYAVIHNTSPDKLGKIYLMNDNSNELTCNLLHNLEEKYGNKVQVITNETNLGFVKNVNKGLSLFMENKESDCVLLLNTDCLIAKNTIEKLMNHIEHNKKIGLICPISSNAANITLDMYPGYSYMMMDQLLERKFKGICFDACTVVGNCLMITKKCIQKVGKLDEIYGMGYCEETDYQFQAMSKGFQAKVAIDTYVFHKAEVSFDTTNKPRSERLEHNLKIFYSRWKEQYDAELKKYMKNDPIQYIETHLSEEDKKIQYDEMFILPFASKTSGGVRVIVDIINYLSIRGRAIGMLNLYPGDYNEIMLFNPATITELEKISTTSVIGTIYESMFLTKRLSIKYNAKCIYFSQGYEFVFENGARYGEVEMSFKMAEYVISVSNYLANTYKDLFHIDAIPIINGIDTDLAKTKKTTKNRSITMVLRNEQRKQDYLVIDLLKHITEKLDNVVVNLIINNKNMVLGVNNNETVQINKYYGPLTRPEIYEILKSTDIFIDTSISEGFGLMPLEAMAFGAVPVVSNSFGINDFINQKNGFIIDAINNPYQYIEKIKLLLNDDALYKKMSTAAYQTVSKFDFDAVAEKYLDVFERIHEGQIEPIKQTLTEEEMNLLSNYVVSDEKLKRIIKESKHMKQNHRYVRKRSRMLRLIKEIIKTNLFFAKEFLKIIFKRQP